MTRGVAVDVAECGVRGRGVGARVATAAAVDSRGAICNSEIVPEKTAMGLVRRACRFFRVVDGRHREPGRDILDAG